jgi:hypothetical protein
LESLIFQLLAAYRETRPRLKNIDRTTADFSVETRKSLSQMPAGHAQACYQSSAASYRKPRAGARSLRAGFNTSFGGFYVIRHFRGLMASCLIVLFFSSPGVIPPGFAADNPSSPSLTIYNQNFAVVRQQVSLDLKSEATRVRFTDITMHLEPDSVILRDPGGKRPLQVLEQNYRADPVSEALLLSLYEGKTIDFLMQRGDKQELVPGKIIRSGFLPHNPMAQGRYGAQYYATQMTYVQGGGEQPIIEMEGKIRFGLPGTPVFPALADDTILKPTLQWLLASDRPGPLQAELSYVTGGFTWQADYNIVAPEKGDTVDIVGWVTMDNQSGKDFENARIKLMAGDVNKIQPGQEYERAQSAVRVADMNAATGPPVTEKTFDEYHLYTLARPTTLHDRETKQVEFVRAANVQSKQIYIYDGAKIDPNRYAGWNRENIRSNPEYGTESNAKIWVMREFANSAANHMDMPLPRGRVRFYRRNDDGQMEFTGENMIDHTPRNETVRIYTGNAFDIAGERRRTDYRVESNKRLLDESFEIRLRNHKKEAVKVGVVEHLYRSKNWEIAAHSDAFNKTDSQTVEFPVTLAPDQEKIITYTAHYSW